MNRLILPKLAVLLILVVLIGRLYQLQLVPDEADRFRDLTRARTTRFLPVRPIRGEVFAGDGKTLLAESVPIYTVSVRPADLPSREAQPQQRAEVFTQLSQLLGISTTLTISPALALDQDVVLLNDLTQGLGPDIVAAAQRHELSPPIRLPLAPAQRADAAALVARYRPELDFLIADARARPYIDDVKSIPAMISKGRKTKQGLRDLNSYGPRRVDTAPPAATVAETANPPVTAAVETRDGGVTK